MAGLGCLEKLEDAAYAVYHACLPIAIPESDDYTPSHDEVLIDTVIACLKGYSSKASDDEKQLLQAAVKMIKVLKKSRNEEGFINQKSLRLKLRDFESGKPPLDTSMISPALTTPDTIIPLHVVAQNAAIIIRGNGENVIFESFELLPTSEAVMATKGRLIRHFPQAAVAIPIETFRKEDFQSTLVSTLAKMSWQSAYEWDQATHTFEGIQAEDTADPRMVTELLMGFLNANGSPHQVQGIWKRTREENISPGGQRPWRRSAMWLLLRVTLQLTFVRAGTDIYKRFQVFVLARILSAARRLEMRSDVLYCVNAKIAQRMRKLNLEEQEH